MSESVQFPFDGRVGFSSCPTIMNCNFDAQCITHVLTVSEEYPFLFHVEHEHIPLDHKNPKTLADAVRYIVSVLEDPEAKLVVHCEFGKVRSPTVTGAYYCLTKKMSPVEMFLHFIDHHEGTVVQFGVIGRALRLLELET